VAFPDRQPAFYLDCSDNCLSRRPKSNEGSWSRARSDGFPYIERAREGRNFVARAETLTGIEAAIGLQCGCAGKTLCLAKGLTQRPQGARIFCLKNFMKDGNGC
jgi:hypothetical protein